VIESWFGRVLLWLFLTPFALIGLLFPVLAAVMGFSVISQSSRNSAKDLQLSVDKVMPKRITDDSSNSRSSIMSHWSHFESTYVLTSGIGLYSPSGPKSRRAPRHSGVYRLRVPTSMSPGTMWPKNVSVPVGRNKVNIIASFCDRLLFELRSSKTTLNSTSP